MVDDGNTEAFQLHQRQVERAYKTGLLHGINAQSMAQVKTNVLEFEDFEW